MAQFIVLFYRLVDVFSAANLIRERLRPLSPYYTNAIAPETLPAGVQDDAERKWECAYCAVAEQCQAAQNQES